MPTFCVKEIHIHQQSETELKQIKRYHCGEIPAQVSM